MEPYLIKSRGYAFFISSEQFTGRESVTVTAPAPGILPDIGTASRVLNQYSGKQWYISDQERILSAQGGALQEGEYVFEIRSDSDISRVIVPYQSSFLDPSQNIQIQDSNLNVNLSWSADPRAHTFWIFVFPADTKNILRDLIAVSSVMHTGNHHQFLKSGLKPGRYKAAIRSNQLWEGGLFWGLQSEAWGISSDEFSVN